MFGKRTEVIKMSDQLNKTLELLQRKHYGEHTATVTPKVC